MSDKDQMELIAMYSDLIVAERRHIAECLANIEDHANKIRQAARAASNVYSD